MSHEILAKLPTILKDSFEVGYLGGVKVLTTQQRFRSKKDNVFTGEMMIKEYKYLILLLHQIILYVSKRIF